MAHPKTLYQPYAVTHKESNSPGDAGPTAFQVAKVSGMTGKLGNKTILITGCSSGICVEAARALYETGAKLFLTARDLRRLSRSN